MSILRGSPVDPLDRRRADFFDHLETGPLTAGVSEMDDRILFHLSDGGSADSTCLAFGIDREELLRVAVAANEPELVAIASA